MTTVSPRPWARLPRELAGALTERLEPTVEDVARTVSESVPAFAAIDEPKFERDVQHAVRVAVERFLELVGTDEPALPAAAREVFVALGAAEARDERSPEVLLAALRTASRVLLRVASGALDSLGPAVDGDLLDLVDAVTAFVDELVATTTDGYALQLQEQAGETDRRRRLLGDLLLRGGVGEPVVLAAAADIGWPTLGQVTPVLLPLEQARDARFRYGAEGVVVDRERDAVLLVRAGRRAGREQLAEALRGRGAVVGPTVPWAHVPEAVRLAQETAQQTAQETAQQTGRVTGDHPDRGAVVFAVDHLADLALRGDAGAMTALADRRLEPFVGMQPAARDRLLRTLHSWLVHWGSRSDVAAELFIHPQTVSYRIRRLRALLGDDLSDPVARFELLLVLAVRASA